MRRAVEILAPTLAILAALIPGSAAAAERMGLINAIGLIDFGNKPDFKTGSWASYHVVARRDSAVIADYKMTVLIAGEEHWWGEDCFWIETVTTNADGSQSGVASLMSYEVFKDSLALRHMQFYVRKIVNRMDEHGQPVQELYKRPTSTLHVREPMEPRFGLDIDTIGTETLHLDKGDFLCKKVKFLQGRGQTGAQGDSSDYTELRETRTSYMTPRVPITHIAREDIDQVVTRKAWKVGKSSESKGTVTLEDTRGVATLVDFGENGKSRIFLAGIKAAPALDAERRNPSRATTPKPRAAARRPG